MKILSPAGNLESLKMAAYNGADEVYLGINDFNARNNIDGFNLDNLEEAVDFAHIYGVKVNLAINILFSDEELQSALDTVVDAYNLGVDSFIIQDLGLAKLVHTNYPEIEIHASTQMGLHNLEGVQNVLKYGFKRIVLARETPLEEIKRIKENTNVEIEYFAQGALCVSFSGNCYLSSYLCNASGNRGKCKQFCRLPYTMKKNGKQIKTGYLLSAKDFNMIQKLKDLETAGVDVLKIEGRARRPYYVAMATREYYNAIHKNSYNQENLKLAFNRNFTPGYFDGNGDVISNVHNHIGIFIGMVEKVKLGKKFNEIIFSSNRKISPKSTIKIFDNENEISTISAYDLKEIEKNKYMITTKQTAFVGNKVHLIVDAKHEETILNQTRKTNINIQIYAEENKPLKAIFQDEEIFGDNCEKAKNQPLTKEEIVENFNKNELFNAKLDVCKLENVFIPKQKLNEFRRNVFSYIKNNLTSKYKHNLQKITVTKAYKINKFKDFKIVENLNEPLDTKNIIYSPEVYNFENIIEFKNKCEKTNKKAFLDTPNFALKKDIELLKDIINQTKLPIIANNYYALSFDTEIVIGGGLNVYNHKTASEFDKPILTAESEISTRIDYPYMTLRHCPFKSHMNAKCSNCPYSDGYTYTMENGKILKLKRKKLSSCTFYLTN